MGSLFWIANGVACIGWIALLARGLRGVALARAVAILLATGYLVIFALSLEVAKPLLVNYSLAGVQQFFLSPATALVGWVHYLAFDIWVATWEVEEAERVAMPRAALIPCLLLTFLMGPIGLLLFLFARKYLPRPAPSL